MLDRVSDPQLSEDGRWLAYSLRSTDWDANGGCNSIWILDHDRPELPPRRIETSDNSARLPRWHPQGPWLYFLSSRSGSPQIWRSDALGSDPTQVTDLPVAVKSYRLSPDGQTLVLALGVSRSGDGPSVLASRTASKRNPLSAMVFERLPVFIWDEWRTGEFSQLFALTLEQDGTAKGPPFELMKDFDAEAPQRPGGNDTDFAVTNAEVIFSAMPPDSAWGIDNRYSLYASPLDGSAPPRLVRSAAADSFVRCAKPTLSPDGRHLAFLAQRSGFDDARVAVMVLDLVTGAEREVDPDFDRSATSLIWAPDGQLLYATMPDLGRTRLFAIDIIARTVSALTESGEVEDVTAAAGRLVVARSSIGGPAQLFELMPGAEVQLTKHNDETLTGLSLSPYEQFSFAGWNGEKVYGYVTRPHGYASGGKYPVAFLIHGGPHGSFSDAWSYRWNPQVWAGMGFAVVSVDFHGSNGYGEAFTRASIGHWGDRPLEDLQKGWAAALARYPFLDADRACALGASYGGYMVSWIAGVWNEPWRCFVNHDGIVDTRGMATSSDVTGWMDHEFGGSPFWENTAKYEAFNPLEKISEWSKPILVIHGGKDYRVPASQGIAAFTLAQRRGVPSKFVYYPDEGHQVLKPHNSVDWYRNVEEWMRRWLLG